MKIAEKEQDKEKDEALQVEKNERKKIKIDFLKYFDNIFKCAGYKDNNKKTKKQVGE